MRNQFSYKSKSRKIESRTFTFYWIMHMLRDLKKKKTHGKMCSFNQGNENNEINALWIFAPKIKYNFLKWFIKIFEFKFWDSFIALFGKFRKSSEILTKTPSNGRFQFPTIYKRDCNLMRNSLLYRFISMLYSRHLQIVAGMERFEYVVVYWILITETEAILKKKVPKIATGSF